MDKTKKITIRKKDIIWNYIGTFVSMGGSFLLLPFLLFFLDSEELGLWYVFLAISNFSQLLEFGFTPTFSRNITYCISGIQKLSKDGFNSQFVGQNIDWHLLRTLLKTAKIIYCLIAVVVTILVSTIGTVYICYITRNMGGCLHWISWSIFIIAIFINIFFLYQPTFLRGIGDIEGVNKATTAGKLFQLFTSILLLICGFGLIGAALGFLLNGLLMRIVSGLRFRGNKEISNELAADKTKITFKEIKSVFESIYFLAWRDGIVQLSSFCTTQVGSIICSIYLGLSTTGTYSLLLQIGSALCSMATALAKSFMPAFQSAYVKQDYEKMESLAEKGLVGFWILVVFGFVSVVFIAFPILQIFKPDVEFSLSLFLGICLYLSLWNQHSLCCNFIICTNKIPYMKAYSISAILSTLLALILVQALDIWALIFGPLIVQLLYNNWKWPTVLSKILKTPFYLILKKGFVFYIRKTIAIFRRSV